VNVTEEKAVATAVSLVARTLGVALGCDTSEVLTLAQYQFLCSLGYTWIARYVPLAGGSASSPGVIGSAELAALVQSGLGLMLVQIPRTSGWSSTTGAQDGQAAATYARSLGYPPTAALWCDLAPPPTRDEAVAYVNGWLAGLVAGGMASSAGGIYCEPGVPLTASERYRLLNVTRYWATAAADPQRFPTPRGCQLVQSWGSKTGSYNPELGLVIDGDVSQLDWFGGAPIAAFPA
jgi:hypothetical protein